MFHSLPHFLTPTQTSPPERTAPDSLRREASQAAGAAPTLRYGLTGDSAPRLRLKAAGMAERFLSARSPLFQSKDEPEEMIRVGCGRTDCNSADEAIGDRPRAFHQEPGRPDFSFPAAQASSD